MDKFTIFQVAHDTTQLYGRVLHYATICAETDEQALQLLHEKCSRMSKPSDVIVLRDRRVKMTRVGAGDDDMLSCVLTVQLFEDWEFPPSFSDIIISNPVDSSVGGDTDDVFFELTTSYAVPEDPDPLNNIPE